MEEPDDKPLETRILVIGAGAPQLEFARLLRSLRNVEVVMVEDEAEAAEVYGQPDPMQNLAVAMKAMPPLVITRAEEHPWPRLDPPQYHDWYRQFDGRNGRPPRY